MRVTLVYKETGDYYVHRELVGVASTQNGIERVKAQAQAADDASIGKINARRKRDGYKTELSVEPLTFEEDEWEVTE